MPKQKLNDNTADLDSVSKRLKHVIKQSGIKQSHIAKKLGVTRGAVHYILNNDAKNPRSAKKIADLLGVDSEWLYTGKKNDTDPTPSNPTAPTNGANLEIPVFFMDQLLMHKQNTDARIQPISMVTAQRTYSQKLLALQLAINSPLQKFEAGDIVILAEQKTCKTGDWILAYHVETEKMVFGLVTLDDAQQTIIICNKIDHPLLLRKGNDDMIGVFVESVKFAKP